MRVPYLFVFSYSWRCYTKHYFEGGSRICSSIGGGGFKEMYPIEELYEEAPIGNYQEQGGVHILINSLEGLAWTVIQKNPQQGVEYAYGKRFRVKPYTNRVGDLYDVVRHYESYNGDPEPVFYYHTDHLGSASYITDEMANVVQQIAYLPYGEEWVDIRSNGYFGSAYKFNGKEKDDETGYNYYGARYYTDRLSIWLSVDPLADKYPSLSPYSYCANNPVRYTDPTGMYPVYDPDGNLLGTDDNGLQGHAIFMNKDNFKQGMSYKEAMKYDLGIESLANQDAIDRYTASFEGLKYRPDWDGYLTLSEANDWYRNGNGQPLFVDLNKIDLSGIVSLGEKFVGQVKTFNLLFDSGSLNDGLVYGNITLKRYSNHAVRAFSDTYDFDMKSWANPLNWGRNIETIIGQKVAGHGKSYEINVYGSKKLKPILPWIK